MDLTYMLNHERLSSFLGGATAGFCVDLTLYPVDTIKTRLQSASHSIKPTGSRSLGLFAGLPAVILGSAPAAALFFFTYESVKQASLASGSPLWLASMLSACCGDVIAYIVRVPVETIKQRTQSQPHLNVRTVLRMSIASEGWRGLYRGYLSQLSRGLPFCLIQYPIWESLKRSMEEYNRRQVILRLGPNEICGPEECTLSKKQFALCGAIAGAIGGTCTTPMDVAKTRIMLAQKGTPLATGNVVIALRTIYREGGVSGLFAGVVPRICIMSFGGAIFLGLYDITKRMWLNYLPRNYINKITSLWSTERAVQLSAGATAGLFVDVVLYPVDTLKTRLQSSAGTIYTPGGRLRLFAGLPAVLLGSAPASAVFFYFYEVTKEVCMEKGVPMWAASMMGTTAADITSMVLWVPCENVKQSAQSRPMDSLRSIFRSYIQHEGWTGLYRGYVSTVVRDLPCALIQFPIWEALKKFFARRNAARQSVTAEPSTANLTGFQFALCGFLSGAVAGSVTTPLDVAKTRIMLAERNTPLAAGRISTALKVVYEESGIRGCFAGLLPRMGLLSVGGGIFLGLYDITKSFWESVFDPRKKPAS